MGSPADSHGGSHDDLIDQIERFLQVARDLEAPARRVKQLGLDWLILPIVLVALWSVLRRRRRG